jgi:translocation protein SEC62
MWAGLVMIAVFAAVLFPLWPLFMRQGVWYLSVGAMGLIGLFFAMAIVRLILFVITFFLVPPGLWLYPNLFEDVGFFDSFRPMWGWQETKEDVKRKKEAKKAKKAQKLSVEAGEKTVLPESQVVSSEKTTPATNGAAVSSSVQAVSAPAKRHTAPTVEEADDE